MESSLEFLNSEGRKIRSKVGAASHKIPVILKTFQRVQKHSRTSRTLPVSESKITSGKIFFFAFNSFMNLQARKWKYNTESYRPHTTVKNAR